MLRRKPPGAVGIEGAVEEPARIGRGHAGLAVRRSPLKDEAAVAIAALDEARVLVDPEIDARMAERRRDFARTVAGDLQGRDADHFGRWDLGCHAWQLAMRMPAPHKLVG